MVLPGISGSFVILMLGLYEKVIISIKSLSSAPTVSSVIFLSVFSSGCLAGLLLFSRLMKKLLEKYRDQTLFFLMGLVAGSAMVLWPFKEYGNPGTGDVDSFISSAPNILPGSLGEAVLPVLFTSAGLLCSWLIGRLSGEGDKV
jgi:putative membrane protein